MASVELTNQGDVLIGSNRLLLNAETMNRIVADWLHVHMAGGPYEVSDIMWDKGNCEFDITVERKEIK